MNGKRYLLDTNAVVILLQGGRQVLEYIKEAEWIGISVLSQIEFLSFSGLTENDKFCFDKFLHRIEVIDLNSDKTELLDEIIRLRQQYHLKLPDTIIAGTAIFANAVLITGDKQLLKIRELKILDFT